MGPKKKKKNPNDATFRNINALKGCLVRIEGRIARLEGAMSVRDAHFLEMAIDVDRLCELFPANPPETSSNKEKKKTKSANASTKA